MKAFILAAGKGTRLKPLTDEIPKALVKINDKTLLEINIMNLINFGIKDIIINTWYLKDKIHNFIKQKNFFDINITFSDEPELLDTGGAILYASKYLLNEDCFLVHNVDIISDININEMLKYHRLYSPIATLAVSNRKSSRYLLFDNNLNLTGWSSINEIKSNIPLNNNLEHVKLSFSGIHIISNKIFNLISNTGKFSIIEEYINIISKGHLIKGYIPKNNYWFDIGDSEKLARAKTFFSKHEI